MANNLLARRIGRQHRRRHARYGRHQQEVVVGLRRVASRAQPPAQGLHLGIVPAMTAGSYHISGRHGDFPPFRQLNSALVPPSMGFNQTGHEQTAMVGAQTAALHQHVGQPLKHDRTQIARPVACIGSDTSHTSVACWVNRRPERCISVCRVSVSPAAAPAPSGSSSVPQFAERHPAVVFRQFHRSPHQPAHHSQRSGIGGSVRQQDHELLITAGRIHDTRQRRMGCKQVHHLVQRQAQGPETCPPAASLPEHAVWQGARRTSLRMWTISTTPLCASPEL